MGEYARFNNDSIKIGTCEDMYYLRLSDAHRVQPVRGNVDPVKDKGLRFRLPFPDEDDIQPGHYQEYNRGLRLYQMVKSEVNPKQKFAADYSPDWLKEAKPGSIQLTHDSGLLVNVPCHHGVKLPEITGATVFWNGKSHSMELSSIKTLEDGSVVPVVKCRHCGEAWRTTWDEVLPFIGDEEMKARLAIYATVTEEI